MDQVKLNVNGEEVAVAMPPETPLLYALRGPLGKKTARFGCGDGLCGACTVILDGRAVMSCDTPLSEAAGRNVQTAEGLTDGTVDHPLLVALLDTQAGQCGYCLPGILMAAKALLDENPVRDRAEIAEALDGNFCRCAAHNRILAAVEKAAATMAEGRA